MRIITAFDRVAVFHLAELSLDDTYDEWVTDRQPPIPTPQHVAWYHATFLDLPKGTVLAPGGHRPPWLDNPYHGGTDNRAKWTWVEHELSLDRPWLRYMVRDHGVGYLYEVSPKTGPFPWNGTAREGWVTDAAVILKKIDVVGVIGAERNTT